MSKRNQQDFPGIEPNFLDEDGNISQPWYHFLVKLWVRTGSEQGDATYGDQVETVLTPTSSPYTFTPSLNGTLLVTGGGVAAMTIQRGTTGTKRNVGQFYAGHRLSANDIITISYVSLPQISFFPS